MSVSIKIVHRLLFLKSKKNFLIKLFNSIIKDQSICGNLHFFIKKNRTLQFLIQFKYHVDSIGKILIPIFF